MSRKQKSFTRLYIDYHHVNILTKNNCPEENVCLEEFCEQLKSYSLSPGLGFVQYKLGIYS